MATTSLTRTKTLPDSAAKADFHDLVDTCSVSVSNILNADLASAANIFDTKLSTISTAGKVNITALTMSGGASGMIFFYSGAIFVPLSLGAAGTTLTVNASGTAPYWA